MSKKNFTEGIDVLLGGNRMTNKVEESLSPETRAIITELRQSDKKGPGRPRKEEVDDTYFRTTIIAHRENYERLKVIAMKEGRCFKDVLNDALSAAVETYEEKNGRIELRESFENPFKK